MPGWGKKNSTILNYLRSLQPGSRSSIGTWVAPRFCCIAEFFFPYKGSPSVAWSEKICFSNYSELFATLRGIVKKRWLQGKAVTISLATAEIFTASVGADEAAKIEESDILPPGISWKDVEYTIVENDANAVFSCMRLIDIEFWVGFFMDSGLVPGAIIPAGRNWSRFVEGGGDIGFTLSSGTLLSRTDGGWKGLVFIPALQPSSGSAFPPGFEAPVKLQFTWCAPILLPALEGVLMSMEAPYFNLNLSAFPAENAIAWEKNFKKFLFTAFIGLGLLIAIEFTCSIGFGIWRTHALKGEYTESTAKIATLKQENTLIAARIASIQSVMKTNRLLTGILQGAGELVKDSVWYSEMTVSNLNAVKITVIGHALSESSIARLLFKAEGMPGVKNARLEFTEKISSDQVARLTAGQRNVAIYRFKLILTI